MMFFKKKDTPSLTREKSMNGYPVQLPLKREEKKDGKLYVTIEFTRPKWQQRLGADPICERSFGLDDYGQEIFAACDGKTNIMKIIKNFAKKHKITIAEAETCVSTFMQTLMKRGIIGIQIANGTMS
jgi:hypothetical protein